MVYGVGAGFAALAFCFVAGVFLRRCEGTTKNLCPDYTGQLSYGRMKTAATFHSPPAFCQTLKMPVSKLMCFPDFRSYSSVLLLYSYARSWLSATTIRNTSVLAC